MSKHAASCVLFLSFSSCTHTSCPGVLRWSFYLHFSRTLTHTLSPCVPLRLVSTLPLVTHHHHLHTHRDATAASCLKAVHLQLQELEAQQSVLDGELKAEQEVQERLSQLR